MFCLFFFCASCHHVFDFSNKKRVVQIIYMNPLDLVDIKVGTNYGIIVSDLKECKGLYMNVETLKSNKTYGPFDYKSRLMLIAIMNEPYKLRLVNEGTNKIKFGLIISKHYDIIYSVYFPEDFYFPLIKYSAGELRNQIRDDINFFYDDESDFNLYILYYIGALAVFNLIILILSVCFVHY